MNAYQHWLSWQILLKHLSLSLSFLASVTWQQAAGTNIKEAPHTIAARLRIICVTKLFIFVMAILFTADSIRLTS